MKLVDVKLSRLIRGPASEVFDVWFDPQSPGGPWYGANKVIMNLAVDGMFYFGLDRALAKSKTPELSDSSIPVGHFGRFIRIDRPRVVEHTWMSEHTHGLETSVSVRFEPREDGTLLTIVHRGIPDDELGRAHESGWTSLLDRVAGRFRPDR
jgi:uncharacterized protein YndB with AHSA1/START domain